MLFRYQNALTHCSHKSTVALILSQVNSVLLFYYYLPFMHMSFKWSRPCSLSNLYFVCISTALSYLQTLILNITMLFILNHHQLVLYLINWDQLSSMSQAPPYLQIFNTFVKVIGMLGSGCSCSGVSSEYCCCCFSIELKASLISLAAAKTRVSSCCMVCSHWTQTPAT